MEIVKVRCLEPVWQYRGKKYKQGDELEMTKDEFNDISKILKFELVKEKNAK